MPQSLVFRNPRILLHCLKFAKWPKLRRRFPEATAINHEMRGERERERYYSEDLLKIDIGFDKAALIYIRSRRRESGVAIYENGNGGDDDGEDGADGQKQVVVAAILIAGN